MKPLSIIIFLIRFFLVAFLAISVPASIISGDMVLMCWNWAVLLLLFALQDVNFSKKEKKVALNASPKKVDKTTNSYIFYEEHKMPCCGKEMKFREGPSGGGCTNILCCHCSQRWNILPMFRVIDKI